MPINPVEFLLHYGHNANPAFPDAMNAQAADASVLKTTDRIVEDMVRSYQLLDANVNALVAKHHKRALIPDGVIGPATLEAMALPRCGYPDYGGQAQSGAAAVGSGNWPKCHNIGNFHCAVVMVDETNMPAWLKPLFVQVLRNCQKANDEIGLRLVFINKNRVDYLTGKTVTERVDIKSSWVNASTGWIGLAIVGQGIGCDDQEIWQQFLATYKGGATDDEIVMQWSSLWRHENGHNEGLSHTSGGTMNPSIIRGLPPTWRNDPSESLLRQKYGGTPSPPAAIPAPTAERPAASQTTVCACQGFNESVCLCRKAGMTCHCTRTSGSVWERSNEGVAWVKTSRKGDPRQPVDSTPVESSKDGTTLSRPADGIDVEILPDGRGRWLHPTLGWRQSNGPLRKGLLYRDLLYGEDGKMHPYKVVEAVPVQNGHWETRCHGTWCERVWVSN